MVKQNIRSIHDVSKVLELYYKDPQKVLKQIILGR